eukprot:6143400-Amphidinium_carterae.1
MEVCDHIISIPALRFESYNVAVAGTLVGHMLVMPAHPCHPIIQHGHSSAFPQRSGEQIFSSEHSEQCGQILTMFGINLESQASCFKELVFAER